ncbi:MAG: hypothetical protein JOZ15_09630 [Acidobacteria bacterium]|nr:hypothetical protein [Acidobacteriota bacterium]
MQFAPVGGPQLVIVQSTVHWTEHGLPQVLWLTGTQAPATLRSGARSSWRRVSR